MAIWQFHCDLLPSNWVAANREKFAATKSHNEWDQEYGWDLSTAWSGHFIDDNLLKEIDEIMPRSKHWSPESYYWKSVQHDSDITLSPDGIDIDSLTVRLDLRGDVRELISSISAFAVQRQYDLFAIEVGEFYKADAKSLAQHATQSRAASFAQNPRGFIADLAKELDVSE